MKSKHTAIFFSFFLFFLLITQTGISQYLHRNGKSIVDGAGNEVILRGMGLGGWMLQEGYMLETSNFAGTQSQIKAKITEVVGESNMNTFYNAWLANHCTKRDIDSLAAWGFNSVRLPMHYNLFTLPVEKEPVAGQHTWLDKGFQMVDDLLDWCEANHMYLILDLHATPGGQGKDANISDYDPSKPSLWQSEANQQKTIALWKKLAERYANEKWIGGYDLINETNWAFQGSTINGCDETVNAPLKNLLVSITTAIRQVDNNHIIFLEGNCWANNYNGLLPFPDNNTVISFHKYWNYNDTGSLQGMLNLRNQYNMPLWLGESGENSNVWFRNAIRLMEDNKIGWAWWPLKKVNSVVNPMTVVKNEGYQQLLDYWKNGGTQPPVDVAMTSLMQLAENLKIENTKIHPDVIDAMFRQVHDDSTIPFKHHKAPGIVHASDFDLGRYNKAYVDSDTATYHVSGGSYVNWNQGWSYRNDGVDITPTIDNDPQANGYNVGWTSNDEWLQYTIGVDSTAAYKVNFRYASSNSASKIKLLVNGVEKTPVVSLPSTSYAYGNFEIDDLVLSKGSQKIRLYFVNGGANISFFKLTLSKKVTELPLRALAAKTVGQTPAIEITLNKTVDPATLTVAPFAISVNNNAVPVKNVSASGGNNFIVLTTDATFTDADVITVRYNGDDVKSPDGTLLEDFSALAVKNNLPVHLAIPGKIEAENFTVNQGLQVENCSDTGGGQDLGYTNAGDYLEYRIRVAEEGDYSVAARIACNSATGRLQFEQLNENREVVSTTQLEVPVTGGWQNWQTVETGINLKAGAGFLRVKIIQPEFNINWFNFVRNPVSGIEKSGPSVLNIYPNPADSVLHLEIPEKLYKKSNSLVIRDSNGKEIKKLNNVSIDELNAIDISFLNGGLYILEFSSKGKKWSSRFVVTK